MAYVAELAIYFFMYSFLGWMLETAYALYVHRRFVNRGFLTGPVCPLYGCGVVAMVTLLGPLDFNFALFFAGAFILTSLLEYLAGWLLELIFHAQWWDYSDYKLNLNGYICLRFSLIWGICATALYYFLHPVMARLVSGIPPVIAYWLAGGAGVIFVVDLITTVASALHLRTRMHEMQTMISSFASALAEDIQNSSFIADRREDLFKIKKEMLERYERLQAKSTVWQRRLLSSFPEVKTKRFTQALDEFKKGIAKSRKKP